MAQMESAEMAEDERQPHRGGGRAGPCRQRRVWGRSWRCQNEDQQGRLGVRDETAAWLSLQLAFKPGRPEQDSLDLRVKMGRLPLGAESPARRPVQDPAAAGGLQGTQPAVPLVVGGGGSRGPETAPPGPCCLSQDLWRMGVEPWRVPTLGPEDIPCFLEHHPGSAKDSLVSLCPRFPCGCRGFDRS